jgi:hypothetical protein
VKDKIQILSPKRIKDKIMTQATDTDIREIRDLLLGLDKKLEIHLLELDKKLEIHITRTEERFNTIETKMDERFNTIDERLKNTDAQLADIKLQQRSQDNRFWTFFGWLFVAAIGVIAKLAFFSGGN